MSQQPAGPGWYQASDGRWYPPQPLPQTQVIVQQKSNRGCWIAAGIVGLVAVLLFGGCAAVFLIGAAATVDSFGQAKPGQYESTVSSCTSTSSGYKATGTLTNRTSVGRSFHMTVQWVDANNTVLGTDSLVSVRSLQPGQNGTWEADTFGTTTKDPASCNVTRVDFFGS